MVDRKCVFNLLKALNDLSLVLFVAGIAKINLASFTTSFINFFFRFRHFLQVGKYFNGITNIIRNS